MPNFFFTLTARMLIKIRILIIYDEMKSKKKTTTTVVLNWNYDKISAQAFEYAN